MDRPTCGKFASLKTVCLAQFSLLYYKKLFQIMIISQTFLKKTLKKKMIVTQHFQKNTSKKPFQKSLEIRRNQMLVLRYYKPNRQLYPEKLAYHDLLLFYPFINESDFFSKDGIYSSKLLESVVSVTVNQN